MTYLIMAISFAMMYHWRYIHETFVRVNMAVEVNKLSCTKSYSPILMSIIMFLLSALLMPIFALDICFRSRDTIVNEFSKKIIDKCYA